MGEANFRERARRQFEATFGPHQVLETEAGSLYRWVLTRPSGKPIYITLDSPEMTHIAHILVSDPESTQLDPISSLVMRTDAEVVSAVTRVKEQHQLIPEAERIATKR